MLSEYGRAQHRNLFLAASIGILVELLSPTRLSAVGVNIEDTKRTVIHVLLILAIVYFWASFEIAARADRIFWFREFTQAEWTRDELDAHTHWPCPTAIRLPSPTVTTICGDER